MRQGFMMAKQQRYNLCHSYFSILNCVVYFCNMYSILLQIKVLPTEHNYPTTKRREGKMATQDWCASRLTEWLKKNPNKCPKDARDKLEDDYGIKLKYSKAWAGMKLALQYIHGKYEESFQLLVNWKAQMELISPGSIVEIEVEGNKKQRFKRIFVALKPCVDGFFCRLQTICRGRCHMLKW